ncbi:unnamed protein product [Cylindrotheca closterium]|uniref:Prokaryotic-type class I peptide chain release factors domain-containing protein n=1 Tax=Cylindrotheca closterium TaxID=2856 RepID=A0AAD2G224_9STRA|nr:unnamed protein product [Cylindrotheca closterium]
MAAFVTNPIRPAFGVQATDTLGRREFSYLLSSNSEEEEKDIKPTWTYEPYSPATNNANMRRNPNSGPPRRSFSTWTVPKTVSIPEDKLEISFVRSSGSGGQNVNKLSTKVELRFHVMQADWMPREVRERLSTQQSNRINKEGFMTITSQENRTQGMNRKAALDKLKVMVLEAWPRPKIRRQREGISQGEKRRRKEFKKKRSAVKANRKQVKDW